MRSLLLFLFASGAAAGSSVSVGFIIGGTGTMQVLLRGVGPALSGFGVSGVLADPTLTVYSGSTVIASNVGWSTALNASAIAAASALVGAFAPTAGSKDSAQLVTLSPGAYSLTVSGSSGDAGTALAEMYVVH